MADDLLKENMYEQVFVIGIDVLSEFIVNGFQSLFALSEDRSKPFDAERKGINLGEAAACILISKHKIENQFCAELLGGSSSNDANHISGPSRTGEGLVRSINKTLKFANTTAQEIDFISAHGTATKFNDEMESIALGRVNLENCAVNSFKAYLGHTLGAAGIIETIFALKSMEKNMLIKSLGYKKLGVSRAINIVPKNSIFKINTILKTASGFGGGNATLIIKKAKFD